MLPRQKFAGFSFDIGYLAARSHKPEFTGKFSAARAFWLQATSPPSRWRPIILDPHRNISKNCALPHYADLNLDRASHIRKDTARLQQLYDSKEGKFVLLHSYSGLLSRLSQNASEPCSEARWRAATLTATEIPEGSIDEQIGNIFLGLDESQRPHFAVSVTAEGADEIARQNPNNEWVELRREGGPYLLPHDAALMAYAAGMVSWARKNLLSSVTGNVLQPLQAGHARGAEGERAVFTRIDPAVIMAVTFGDWILLGRQAGWSRGRFSLLAGFCEVGETLEQAVVRETLEEAGVHVELTSVKYHSSQPWPFPQSLMVGFTASAVSSGQPDILQGQGAKIATAKGIRTEEIAGVLSGRPLPPKPDDKELESAFWFHRSFVAASLHGKLPQGVNFAIPGPHALANIVITEWAMKGSQASQSKWRGEGVADVDIDVGRFKYVLMRLSDKQGTGSKLVIRGSRSMPYHADILEAFRDEMEVVGLQVEELGGGRIENSIEHIIVFGYSTAYGSAPHELAGALLQRRYPIADIVVQYSGY